jgi:hypothetical protein
MGALAADYVVFGGRRQPSIPFPMTVVWTETRQTRDNNFTNSSIATDTSFEDYHCMQGSEPRGKRAE